MLKLSQQNLLRFQQDREKIFIDQLAREVFAPTLPPEHVGDAKVMARAAMTEAVDLGFRQRGQISGWAALRAQFGHDLAARPWVAEVLADTALLPEERHALILERATFRESGA